MPENRLRELSLFSGARLEEDCSEPNSSDFSTADTSSSTTTVSESSRRELRMDYSTGPQFSAMSVHSSVTGSPKAIREWLMSSQADSHASHSALPERGLPRTTQEICGLKPSRSLAEYDPDTRCWRTCQVSLITNTPDEFSETWPKSGLIQDGMLYLLPRVAPHTGGTGYGLLPSHSIPTPTASDHIVRKSTSSEKQNPLTNKTMSLDRWVNHWPTPTAAIADKEVVGSHKNNNLVAYAKMFPTPPSTDYKGARSLKAVQERARNSTRGVRLPEHLSRESRAHVGGQLNPNWVEWLMGWPIGWTDLKPLEMDKYQEWLQQHGEY